MLVGDDASVAPAPGVAPPICIGTIVELGAGVAGIGAIVGLVSGIDDIVTLGLGDGDTAGSGPFVERGVGGLVMPGIGAIVDVASGDCACAESGSPRDTRLKARLASCGEIRTLLNMLPPVVCFPCAMSS